MPEYEVRIKFHIFPYRKFNITARDKAEAREIANANAKHIVDNLNYTIEKIRTKRRLIDDFL